MLDEYVDFYYKGQIIPETEKVDSQTQFDELIGKLLEFNIYRNLQWRGMHNANLMLFNSCQRYYNRISRNKDLEQYHDFIRNLVDYVYDWNNNTILRYLENQRIDNDVVAVLSLMQHFGFPTPLLDFSENPFIALYFASQDSDFDTKEDDIRNYSSLYALDTNVKTLKDFNKQYKIDTTPYADQFKSLFETPLLVISKDQPEFKISTSLNIINQSGLFIYSYDPTLSLEQMLQQVNKLPDQKSILKCWNIHKKFNRQIRVFLKRENNITSDYIYPNLYKMIEDFHKGIS